MRTQTIWVLQAIDEIVKNEFMREGFAFFDRI